MITLHFHLQPQYRYELFHINFTKMRIVEYKYKMLNINPTYTGSIFVCGPLHHYIQLFRSFGAVGLCSLLRSRYQGRHATLLNNGCEGDYRSLQTRHAAHFKHGLAMIFLRDSLCLSAVSLSRQRHDILDFSHCPLSRVLYVTLTNWQRFRFQFHLRSSPSAYSGFVNIRPAEYFTACYTVLRYSDLKTSKLTKKWHPDAMLDSVRMAIHFFVNFDIFQMAVSYLLLGLCTPNLGIL